jgi:hypothetical protein
MTESKEQITQITVHNKVSANYTQVHVDGAFGGITPQGLLNLSFYAERAPIPKSSDFKVEDNKVGELISDSEDSKKGILREFEFGIYMTPPVAKALIVLLANKLVELEKAIKTENETNK